MIFDRRLDMGHDSHVLVDTLLGLLVTYIVHMICLLTGGCERILIEADDNAC